MIDESASDERTSEKPRETLPDVGLVEISVTLDLRFVRAVVGEETIQTAGEAMAAEVLLMLQDAIIAGSRRYGIGVRGKGSIAGKDFEL